MKKGFTLMEVLAVILVLAVVTTLAAPVFKSVRYEMRQAQAKVAAKKLAEALKTYYQVSRGGKIYACFDATDADVTQTTTACSNPSATGIPQTTAPTTLTTAKQLFACGYLSSKDFVGLPYTFCTNHDTAKDTVVSKGWDMPSWDTSNEYAIAFANDKLAGEKYFKKSGTVLKGYIYIDNSMDPTDTYDND